MSTLTLAHVSPAIASLKGDVDRYLAQNGLDASDEFEVENAIRDVVYDLSFDDLWRYASANYPEAGAEFIDQAHYPNPLLFRRPEREEGDDSPIAMIERNVVEELCRLFGIDV